MNSKSLYVVICIYILFCVVYEEYYIIKLIILADSAPGIFESILYILFTIFFLFLGYYNARYIIEHNNNDFSYSLKWNRIFFIIQTFRFKLLGIIYSIVLSTQILFFYRTDLNEFGYNIRPYDFDYKFYISADTDIYLGINLFAVAMAIVLYKFYSSKKITEDNARAENENIPSPNS